MPNNKKKIPQPEILLNKNKIPFESEKPTKTEWSFSFKYFNQIKYFGLDKSDSSWFVSLLERFKELSKVEIDIFLRDFNLQDNLRYHEINWEATNIPISRTDCTWVDKDILKNEVDYPFVQFHISKALGRVVGFWDANVFCIVLLDPLHNIQPYNDEKDKKRISSNYKIHDCNILSCQYTSLLKDLDDIKRKYPNCENCNIISQINELPWRNSNSNAVIFFLDDDYLSHFKEISKNKSISEIFENGLINNIQTNL